MSVVQVHCEVKAEATIYPPGTVCFYFNVTDPQNRSIEVPWDTNGWIEIDPICLDVFCLAEELEERLEFFRKIPGMQISETNYEVIVANPEKLVFTIPEIDLVTNTFCFDCTKLSPIVKECQLQRWCDAWANFRNIKNIRLNHQDVDPNLFTLEPLRLEQYDIAILEIDDVTKPFFMDGIFLKNRDVPNDYPPTFLRSDGMTLVR